MKRLLTLLLLPAVAIALTSCRDVSERDCGTFNHPELALWQTDTNSGTVSFMNSDGQRIDFNRSAVEYNTPFLGSDSSSNDEDVICNLTATVRLEATDNSLAIGVTYTQLERTILNAVDETLLVDHRVEKPLNTPLEGDYPADISIDTVRINFNPNRVRYLDEEQTAEFNGQAYEDVVRIYAVGVTPPPPETEENAETDPESETTESDTETDVAETETEILEPEEPLTGAATAIKQIVLARTVGLIAFVDEQNREFIRIPAQ